MQLSLMCFDPISSLHARRSLISSWRNQSFLQFCPKLLPLLPPLSPRILIFVHPGEPTSPSLLAVQVALQHERDPAAVPKPQGENGHRRGSQGYSGHREPRENPAAGLKGLNLPWGRSQLSQNSFRTRKCFTGVAKDKCCTLEPSLSNLICSLQSMKALVCCEEQLWELF